MDQITASPLSTWRQLLKHAALPLIAPAILVALYFTPVYVFGCRNRGFMALGITMAGVIAAIFTVKRSADHKKRGDMNNFHLWLLTTLILLSPLFLLIGPLG